MSFIEQERAMRDLLFDAGLREQFSAQGVAALSAYQLSDEEQSDFLSIRIDALKIDAGMRVFMLLSQLAAEMPVSIVIMSAFEKGIEAVKAMVNIELIKTPTYERGALLGTEIRDWLADRAMPDQKLQSMLLAYVGAEIAVNWSRSGLQKAIMKQEYIAQDISEIPGDWKQKPIELVQYVSAVIVPRSYDGIKKMLCRAAGDQLWSHTSKNPLALEQLQTLLGDEDPRLLVSRAIATQQAVIDPGVGIQTIELSEGFASLMQYINGQYSTDFILQQLNAAGAPDQMLQGVEAGFLELLKTGMTRITE